MARLSRRFVLSTALVLFIMLISAGRSALPIGVKAAFDPNGPAFDPLSVFDTSDAPNPVRQPPRLLAGTNSHALPANATTRNGYCLDVNIDGVTPSSDQVPTANLGFRIFATDPINPANPVPVREVPIPVSGTYVYGAYLPSPGDPIPPGVAARNANAGSSADDVYCVVAFAEPGYKNLHIEWHYQLNGVEQAPIALPAIPIVTVTLEKIGDGIFGSPAEVCTVGWDAAFLTGATSNAGGLSGVVPDPVNDVVVSDFSTSGGSANVFVDYVRKVGTEWCAGIGSTTVESGVQVVFDFDAVYNRQPIPQASPLPPRDNDIDDQPASVQLPGNRLVNIKNVIELRHVTGDGYVPPRPDSGPLVINSLHTICIAGSGPGDTLAATDIHFTPLSGSPGVSNLQVFTKSAVNNPDLVGVADGTLCFRYTSGSPGRHAVQATFSNNGIPTDVFFDTDLDGNGIDGTPPAPPLVTEWTGIGTTAITFGGSPFGSGTNITNTHQDIQVAFNLSDGTFIGGGSVTEWVLGTAPASGNPPLVNGAWLRAAIVSECGYFVVPDASKPTALSGVSVGGQFEINSGDGDPFSPAFGDTDGTPDPLQFSTLNDGGCTQSSTVRIEIQVYYPGQLGAPAAPLEFVEFSFSAFLPALKTPRLAWAGQIVSITYAINSASSCADRVVDFVRPKGQTGTFLPDTGVTLDGAGHASVGFGDQCSATVRYESEDPGEVDVEVFIRGNNFSKVAFPIFYMVMEDISVEATPDQFVSTFGDVTAHVRGYFVGSNPSGRPEEKKADGRVVPKDRWVIPTDWDQLRGPSEFRQNWGSPSMPPAIVTFFMENEGVLNNYKAGVKNGASGFFIPDDPSDFSFNVNPHTKVTTALGTVQKPRMMSQPSEGDGAASVDTFGDMNLTYEGCAPNKFNKNPQCKPEDIAGRTRYYAVAEYPQAGNRGKFPAIASNVAETVWRWAGYKDVTVVNTDSPQIKYVVAHLRDRDGFCDAANYNNTLGVPVRFEIDAGGGTIIDAADRPYTINGTKRFATATTFDTTDVNDRALNVAIAKPPLIADQPDECQAWIKVTNSLMAPTNVMVTFPAPPSPVPGDIRITNLQCDGPESITVKNFGSNVVNLGGFALKSAGTDVGIGEEMDMIGVLAPGESKTFLGGPGAPGENWIGTSSEVFGGSNDFASVVWENFALSTVYCDGTSFNQTPPASFPPDGEGEILIDITIPFGDETDTQLVSGWNLVPTGRATMSIASAFAGHEDDVTAVYAWDATLGEWSHYIPGAPDGVNTIDRVGNGVVLWVLVKQPFTLTLPK